MAHSTPTSSLGIIQLRRKSQVFVEIPPSPIFKTRVASTPYKGEPSTSYKLESQKENTVPLLAKTLMNNIPADKKIRGKRKVHDEEDHATQPTVKKARSHVSEEGVRILCHQCRSKKPSDNVLQCTRISKAAGNRCKVTYCETCLRNRYGEELKSITKSNASKSQEGHADADYSFTCPRCEGSCNCAPCRKKKGLAPFGKFISTQGGSVREILEKDPQASGLLPKNTVMPALKAVTLMGIDKPLKTAKDPERDKIPKRKRDTLRDPERKKPKAAPEPTWVAVPQARTRQEIEDRIYLREFVVRFNPILNIGVRNLEELDDFTSLHDPSTKAILLALLDLIAIEDEPQKKRIQAKIKLIRGHGLNWTRIVPVLHDLRDSLPRGHLLSSLPDLKSSDVEVSHNTRGTRMQSVYADQLLPILLYLAEVAGDGASARQELEEGNKQVKEVRADYLKSMREEMEQWVTVKAELTEGKPVGEKTTELKEAFVTWKARLRKAEDEHKIKVADIRNSSKPEIDRCAPRFASLGCDTDGRIYYTLSASGPQRSKKERLPSSGELSSMKKWGWFIAVYGKPGTVVELGTDNETDDDEGESLTERWWGFSDVEEMRKLSKWLAYRAEPDTSDGTEKEDVKPFKSSIVGTATSSTLTSRLESPSDNSTAISHPDIRSLSPSSALSDAQEDSDGDEMDIDDSSEHSRDANMSQHATPAGMKALAKAILDFADFTEWRLNRDQSSSKKKSDDVISAGRFYEM